MPGPLPKTIEELARVNEVSVLGVWIDDKTMRVEEITGMESELPASA
jgi:TusA-related sulfurtransferase